MLVDGLPIPDRLLRLIDAGVWPRTPHEATKQNLLSIVGEAEVRRLAPEESCLYLYSPPFRLLAASLRKPTEGFWSRFGALGDVDPALAVVIADFGMGSDAPIALDYRASRGHPQVIRLRWSDEPGITDNHWVTCAESLDHFAEILGLGAGTNG